jgi:hypothetical protein
LLSPSEAELGTVTKLPLIPGKLSAAPYLPCAVRVTAPSMVPPLPAPEESITWDPDASSKP